MNWTSSYNGSWILMENGTVRARLLHSPITGWMCRGCPTYAVQKWIPIIADTVEEAKAVATALYRMGEL